MRRFAWVTSSGSNEREHHAKVTLIGGIRRISDAA